jgi:hypothetical protein
MLGWRSLNLELLSLDPDKERVLRKERRATDEVENNMAGNPYQPENEQHRVERGSQIGVFGICSHKL